MAILLTLIIFFLLPVVWRSTGFVMRLGVAALSAQVIVRFFPEALGIVPGALMLALIAGALLIMVRGFR